MPSKAVPLHLLPLLKITLLHNRNRDKLSLNGKSVCHIRYSKVLFTMKTILYGCQKFSPLIQSFQINIANRYYNQRIDNIG